MSDDTFIKLYGERNSGTNYLRTLIASNLDAKLLEINKIPQNRFLIKVISKYRLDRNLIFWHRSKSLGWKHGAPPVKFIEQFSKSKNLLVLIIIKNPYSFLLSLFDRPYEIKGPKPNNFEEFICKPWELRMIDNLLESSLPNPIALWNKKTESFLNLAKSSKIRTSIVRYEDLIEDPEMIIRNYAKENKINFVNEHFFNLENSTKSNDKTFKSYLDYYSNELWKSKLTESNIEFINHHLDPNLLHELNYDLIIPENQ